MTDLKPITPAELCWQEADGAVSINAAAVAERLNALLAYIRRLEDRVCPCENCGLVLVRRADGLVAWGEPCAAATPATGGGVGGAG
jgi:hypothetical protein